MINKNNIKIELFHNAFVVPSKKETNGRKRKDHMRYVLKQQCIDGHILEFGVFEGKSINLIAENYPNDIIYGFDSFEGLPEDWITNPGVNKHLKGYFSVEKLPKVLPNVKLIKGFFDQTLTNWIEQSNIKQIKFLHIDSDLYSSAIFVLNSLNNFIKSGTIIVFDELYPWSDSKYEFWEEGEWKALKEWVSNFDREFTIISRNNHQQVAIRITK
jgi:hypothetical protein